MALDAATIDERLKKTMPHAEITIEDLRGDGAYLTITVLDSSFAGLSIADQHRLVYKALGETTIDPPPSLSLRTEAKT